MLQLIVTADYRSDPINGGCVLICTHLINAALTSNTFPSSQLITKATMLMLQQHTIEISCFLTPWAQSDLCCMLTLLKSLTFWRYTKQIIIIIITIVYCLKKYFWQFSPCSDKHMLKNILLVCINWERHLYNLRHCLVLNNFRLIINPKNSVWSY